jgi:UDP:flavonoid glycosyltransferase YjiC (YdhE family)
MRVLFTTWAWTTHYLPMVPLAWAFRASGHEVRVASQPALSDAVVRSGHLAVLIGRDTDITDMHQRRQLSPLTDGDMWETLDEQKRDRIGRALGMFVHVAEAMADDLVDFTGAWRPDLIIYDPTTFAAPLAAAVHDIPAVRHLWGPDLTGPQGDSFELTVPDELPALFARFGVSDVDTLGALTVDPCPPSMQVPSPIRRQLMRYVPFNGSGVAPSWLLEPTVKPRICVTWGATVTDMNRPEMFMAPSVIAAVARLDAEVVVAITADQRSYLGSLPAEVRVVESLPLSLLAPSCDVIIHQGGPGTALTGLAYGVPQLAIPQLPHHMYNARQLAETGAGRHLTADEARAEVIAAVTEQLIREPGYRAAAAAVRAEMLAQPTPATVVSKLAALRPERASGR